MTERSAEDRRGDWLEDRIVLIDQRNGSPGVHNGGLGGVDKKLGQRDYASGASGEHCLRLRVESFSLENYTLRKGWEAGGGGLILRLDGVGASGASA